MSVLTSLLRCYEYCEMKGFVDAHKGKNAVILPLYHETITAKNNNILKLTLNRDGRLINACFAVDDETCIFPGTEDSLARSGKFPPPHPLEDKMQYCIGKIADENKFKAYMEGFEDFRNNVRGAEVGAFLDSIEKFLNNDQNYEMILSKLPLKGIRPIKDDKNGGKDGAKIEYLNDKNKTIEHNFKDTFVCFEVIGADGKNRSVDTFVELHKEFVKYVNKMSKAKGQEGICNISGNLEPITYKHRGLMGNAKIISVSNKGETYRGRFSSGSDIIKVGRKTSEKIHLMFKFFLQNKNSNQHLADSLFLLNWFSGDVTNSIEFDLADDSDDYMEDSVQPPVSEKNRFVGRTFIKGCEKLNPDWQYYFMLVDKSSNGRMSIRYYKELPNSQLIDNLKKWQAGYAWEKKDFENEGYMEWIPSLNKTLLAAYGTEQNSFLKIDKKKFKKDQFQNLIVALVEGRGMPSNIKNKLAQNIRNRQRYKDSWNMLLIVSLAILSEGRKEYKKMIEENLQTRSYLYGRLLAIYEKTERDVLSDKVKGETEGSSTSNNLSTNAERYWNAFANKPDATMKILESATKYCEIYMLKSSALTGSLVKMRKAKSEIMRLLDNEDNLKFNKNKPLDNDFIFGYYAQKKELYTKKENKNE